MSSLPRLLINLLLPDVFRDERSKPKQIQVFRAIFLQVDFALHAVETTQAVEALRRVLLEVEAVQFGVAQVSQVEVQRVLADANHECSILRLKRRHIDDLTILSSDDSVRQVEPRTNYLQDVLDGAHIGLFEAWFRCVIKRRYERVHLGLAPEGTRVNICNLYLENLSSF